MLAAWPAHSAATVAAHLGGVAADASAAGCQSLASSDEAHWAVLPRPIASAAPNLRYLSHHLPIRPSVETTTGASHADELTRAPAASSAWWMKDSGSERFGGAAARSREQRASSEPTPRKKTSAEARGTAAAWSANMWWIEGPREKARDMCTVCPAASLPSISQRGAAGTRKLVSLRVRSTHANRTDADASYASIAS